MSDTAGHLSESDESTCFSLHCLVDGESCVM